jgi:hypothetical protein
MNRYRIVYMVLYLLVLPVFGISQNGQELSDLDPVLFHERFQLFTDRKIYVVGEEIFFRAFYVNSHELQKAGWSKILYVEVITSRNEQACAGKFRLSMTGSSGSLEIPEGIPTGNYYLKAYTKWMRNKPPENYFYSRIIIINPYTTDLVNTLPINNHLEKEAAFQLQAVDRQSVLCHTNKQIYKQREKVEVSVSLSDNIHNSPYDYCVSVVRTGTADTAFYRINPSDIIDSKHFSEIQYYPETRGLTVTGKVIQSGQESPVANARVYLSMLGENKDFYGVLSDTSGRFRFALPDKTGTQDVYIAAETTGSNPVTILVDKDFSGESATLPREAFALTPSEQILAEEIMLNMQISKAYEDSPSLSYTQDSSSDSMNYFYGEPMKSYRIDDYILLPTLEEFFFEVIGEVTQFRAHDKPYFVLTGNHSDLALYRPLILLDQVPVTDLESVLKVSPSKIKLIDIINATYIRGNIQYGGIISIYSRKGDLAGIDLPANSFFFRMKFLNPGSKITHPLYENGGEHARIPDVRNTLYWNANLNPGKQDVVNICFYTSDVRGEYSVLVHGVSDDGEILEGKTSFMVK